MGTAAAATHSWIIFTHFMWCPTQACRGHRHDAACARVRGGAQRV